MGRIICLISTQRRRACRVTSTRRGISPQRTGNDDEEKKEEAPVKSRGGKARLRSIPLLVNIKINRKGAWAPGRHGDSCHPLRLN